MNIINKLTVRHLKKNKRRTLVTIFGVIISVAMIMAVTTIGISFLDMFKRQVIVSEGAWEANYKEVQSDKLNIITENEHVEDVALLDKQGFANIEEMGLSKKLNKSYIEIYALDNAAYQMYSVELVEGRQPQNSSEIAIPERLFMAQNEGIVSLGDEITLNLGKRQAIDRDGNVQENVLLDTTNDSLNRYNPEGMTEELVDTEKRSYTVVGIIKDTTWEVGWGGSHVAVTAFNDQIQSDNSIDIVGVTFKEKKREIFDHMKAIADSGEFQYSSHNNLLRYNLLSANDSLQTAIYALTGTIMFIVIVGSVSLIYNAFGISVADRSKYLGMLASVGATKRQKRNSVLFEAAIISLFSIPLGLLGGYIGIKVTFDVITGILNNLKIVNMSVGLEVVVTPISIILSVVISLFTIFISSWLPARRASRISAIEAIRMSHDVKITKRQVKNNRLVRKIFGLEADIALKNLKRNKRRYQITVFSLMISIILFISASYFSNLLVKGNSMASEGIDYDLVVNMYNQWVEDIDYEKIVDYPEIEQYTIVEVQNPYAQLPYQNFNDGLKQHIDAGLIETQEDGSYEYEVSIYGLDEKSFDAFIAKNNLSTLDWNSEDQFRAVLLNRVVYTSMVDEKKVEEEALKNPLNLQLPIEMVDYSVTQESSEELSYKTEQIQIAAAVDEAPFGVESPYSLRTLHIVMPQTQLDKLNELYGYKNVNESVYIKTNSPDEVQQYILEQDFGRVELTVWNVNEYSKQTKGIVLILNIFTYGFIALITFVSLANIMNTISTGLQLRKREFAMLRSMGMTEKGFYRMINYESIFYGLKSLLYGIPISIALNYLMYSSLSGTMDFKFELPWKYYVIAIVGIFFIVGIVMYYAGGKIKKGSIVEAIKQENI